MMDKEYVIYFDSLIRGDEDCYFMEGEGWDGDYHFDGAWCSDIKLAKVFSSIEEAQKAIDESKTQIPERWIIKEVITERN